MFLFGQQPALGAGGGAGAGGAAAATVPPAVAVAAQAPPVAPAVAAPTVTVAAGSINEVMQRLFPGKMPSEVPHHYRDITTDQVRELKVALEIDPETPIGLRSENEKFVYVLTAIDKVAFSYLEYDGGNWTLDKFTEHNLPKHSRAIQLFAQGGIKGILKRL